MDIKKIILLFCLFITVSLSYSDNITDSLKKEIEKTQLDSLKIKLMTQLLDHYTNIENYDKALEYLEKVIHYAQNNGNEQLRSILIDKKGRIYRKQGYYDKSLQEHFTALKIAEKINDLKLLGQINNNIGIAYRRKTEDNHALKYHLKALAYAEKSNDEKIMAYSLNSIGIIYTYQKNYTDAIPYFEKALKLATKHDNLIGVAINLNSIAWIYEMQENFKQAIEYYRKSLEINQKINNIKGIAICYNDLGKTYQKIGEYRLSLEYYRQAIPINEKDNDKQYLTINLINIGQVYADLGDYSKSLNELQKALVLAKKLQSKRLLMDTYKQMSVTYEKMHLYKTALQYNQLAYNYNDSIYNEENSKQIAELKTLYETEKKEKENAIQKTQYEQKLKRKNIQRNFSFLLSFLLIIILIVLIRNYLQKRKINTLLERQKKEIEEQSKKLDKANHKIVKNTRLKELFFANTSHELRTPVNIIVGFTNLILSTQLTEKQKKYITNIKNSGKNLTAIVNDILDFSKLEAGKLKIEFKEFNLINSIKDISYSQQIKANDKGIKLSTSIDRTIPENVLGDPNRLAQILNNLLSNAIKFTDEGEVKLSLVKAFENKNELTVEIIIEDTGIGIEQNRLENIFESYSQAFDQTSRQFGGTGLGLSIVKNLVLLLNGDIKVNSTVGKGSKFLVNIPFKKVYESTEKISTESFRNGNLKNIKKLNILLVDDNEVNRALAIDTIQLYNENITINEADNGQSALKKIENNNFDLILMDLLMPVMDGYEATQKIRNELPDDKKNIPILGMTAVSEEDEKIKCLQIGMNDYIIKPFEPEDLFYKIASVIQN